MIVHVSTSQGGGAGNAARRLHTGLIKQGTDSRFVSAQGNACESQWMDVLPRIYPRFWQRAARKLGVGLTAQERWEQEKKRFDCTDVFTSSIDSDSRLLHHHSIRSADVINLHWTAGILPWVDFFRENTKPVVWTLHDMNPFMGIFHYEADRQRGSAASQEVERRIQQTKKKILSSARQPVIVTPSRWLMNQSQASELFRDCRHEHIPYGLDTNVFKPHPQSFSRSVFGLPNDHKLILVVAERLDDYRKGFDLLVDALNSMQVPNDVSLVAVGGGRVPVTSMPCHHLGSIHDERLMALLYSAADYTAITSRQDNLPNVILESLCCGTPVIATPAGGMPEPIVADRDGVVAEAINCNAIADAIENSLLQSFSRTDIAVAAAERFDARVQAQRYLQLYQSL